MKIVDDFDNDRVKMWHYPESLMSGIPEEKALLLVSALLFAVYGWDPIKVSKLKLASIPRWLKYAKKRMTWNDAYKLRSVLKEARQPLWKRILSKIKS